jgi:DNA-binding transcriptional LysR family regulator
MDRLDAMSVFAAIVDAGSLSAAGRRLEVPLATVSRKLSDLEAHLKTRLLARSTRQMTLTDTGRAYLAACREILAQVDEAERGASGAYASARGSLAIAAPVVFGRLHVVPVVTSFLDAYPEVDAHLVLGDRNVNLLDEHIDLAVRIGELPDSGLVATRLGTVRRATCASPDYLARFGTPKTPLELAAHRCISSEGLMSATAWSFHGPRGQRRIRIHSRLTVNTADAAVAAALAGLGLARVLSYQVADALHTGSLVRVLIDYEPAAVPVNLVHAGQGRLPMKCRAFIDHAGSRLRERLARHQGT